MSGSYALLRRVSRSFYLSLILAPKPIRDSLSSTYLIARAADAIADSSVASKQRRLESLDRLFEAAKGHGPPPKFPTESVTNPDERELLSELPAVVSWFHEQPSEHLRLSLNVLQILIDGMRVDLERFAEQRYILADEAALDAHCHAAAGCVGEYWVALSALSSTSLQSLNDARVVSAAISLGKALQLTNVVRDVDADLRDGRCYLPASWLHDSPPLGEHSVLETEWPASAKARTQARIRLVARAEEHLVHSQGYFNALPTFAPRLRLSSLLPALLAQATLNAVVRDGFVSPRVKISRTSVYGRLALALLAAIVPAIGRMAMRRQSKQLQQLLSLAPTRSEKILTT